MSKDILGDRIRIGTNPQTLNPDNPLDLMHVAGANGTVAWFADYDNSGSAPNGFNFRLAQARGTVAVPLALVDADPIFEIESFAYNGTGWSETSEIKCFVDGAVSNGQASPSRLEFWTNVLNAVPTLKLTIKSTGELILASANASILGTGTANTMALSSAGVVGSGSGGYIKMWGQTAAGTPGNIDIVCGSSGTFGLYSIGTISLSVAPGQLTTLNAGIATTAGGSTNGVKFGASGVVGIFFGSGAPSISAPKGALYLRTDGTTVNDRAYINSSGSTTWTAITTVG